MSEGPLGSMSRFTAAKLVLAVAGIATFGLGIRFDSIAVRWAGIGLVAAAWLLRFVKAPPAAGAGRG